MNYLGHLFFSNNDTALMHANIFGDFVKGKDLSKYPEYIQYGIRLHRTIDDYIDHHPVVLDLLHELYAPLPKIAGIAIDLYFDHLLARNWNQFHSVPLDTFIQNFHASNVEEQPYDKPMFWWVLKKMEEGQWLKSYKNMSGLQNASEGLSRRISFENVLNTAPQVFTKNEERITSTFHSYMEDAVLYFEKYFSDHKL